jgi:hypothetical protein
MARNLINIGLAVNGGPCVDCDRALNLLWTLGGVRVCNKALLWSDTEPTLVVETDKPLYPLAALEIAKALRQDAIAQFDGREGQLYGPNALAWGPFDPGQFLTLSGRRLDGQPTNRLRLAA